MTHRLILYGVLPDFNTAITKAKSGNVRGKKGGFANPYQHWKASVDEGIAWQAKDQLRGVKITARCAVVFRWYAPDQMKDPDNIAHAVKYILDGLQQAGTLTNDGWKQVGGGFLHQFAIDKQTPRVEVYLLEGETFEFEP